jgi:hypothetical protein
MAMNHWLPIEPLAGNSIPGSVVGIEKMISVHVMIDNPGPLAALIAHR